MNDNTRIKKAHHEGSDTEQPLVGGNKIQKDSVSDAEFCLSEMKKISQLIETVSQPTTILYNLFIAVLLMALFFVNSIN
jgi:hypothetical protein